MNKTKTSIHDTLTRLVHIQKMAMFQTVSLWKFTLKHSLMG